VNATLHAREGMQKPPHSPPKPDDRTTRWAVAFGKAVTAVIPFVLLELIVGYIAIAPAFSVKAEILHTHTPMVKHDARPRRGGRRIVSPSVMVQDLRAECDRCIDCAKISSFTSLFDRTLVGFPDEWSLWLHPPSVSPLALANSRAVHTQIVFRHETEGDDSGSDDDFDGFPEIIISQREAGVVRESGPPFLRDNDQTFRIESNQGDDGVPWPVEIRVRRTGETPRPSTEAAAPLARCYEISVTLHRQPSTRPTHTVSSKWWLRDDVEISLEKFWGGTVTFYCDDTPYRALED
jgi:hypothetical protein